MHKGSNFSTSSPTLGTFVFVFLFIVTIPNGGKMVSHGFDLLFANGTPLQYSCLENPMDRGAWCAAVHRVAKSRTRLSDWTATTLNKLSMIGSTGRDFKSTLITGLCIVLTTGHNYFLYYPVVRVLEKQMATHSSVLAWRIPGTGEPGGRPSMGSHSVRHDWSDLAAAAAAVRVLQGAYCTFLFLNGLFFQLELFLN